ncbi:1641_t:CDS:2, partial [Entrophospora sp. SA101]
MALSKILSYCSDKILRIFLNLVLTILLHLLCLIKGEQVHVKKVITGTLTELKSDENGGKEYQSVNEGRSIHNIVPNSEIKTSRINRSKNSNIVPFTFHWKDGGNKVFVTGDFNNWSASKHEMKRIPKTNNFVAMIDIDSTKQHEFKFIVDGDWKFSRDFETHHDEQNLSMSEINEDYEDNQEEYDKVTTMEGNIPQC